ncbi:adult-specific cuticular protein ACP-20-like [Lepeophtheirus salmonis]|uniref:adult-specific cuticular protein ACP-20-like n=1 Tax=Lepeophtheirus salmonis TaxID=72036 RepID=UPI001AE2F618|nr:cuticle protein 7-like [Lepeophtheirus salmonis]
MFRSIVLCTLIASTFGDILAPAYQPAPAYKPAPSYKPTTYDESPKPYNYQYAVSDDYSGVNFSAQENSDAKVISGSYTVALPDGRIQTVSYTVDGYSGYVADVSYEGTPTYPKYEPKPAYSPAPAYKSAPTPAYQPTPSYQA